LLWKTATKEVAKQPQEVGLENNKHDKKMQEALLKQLKKLKQLATTKKITR
jgi:hypothetical protein